MTVGNVTAINGINDTNEAETNENEEILENKTQETNSVSGENAIQNDTTNQTCIYTNANFYNQLLSIINNDSKKEYYLNYNIVVEDLIDVVHSDSTKVGSYSSLNEAISYSKNGDIIIVKLDLALNETVVIDKKVTIVGGVDNTSSSREIKITRSSLQNYLKRI